MIHLAEEDNIPELILQKTLEYIMEFIKEKGLEQELSKYMKDKGVE